MYKKNTKKCTHLYLHTKREKKKKKNKKTALPKNILYFFYPHFRVYMFIYILHS